MKIIEKESDDDGSTTRVNKGKVITRGANAILINHFIYDGYAVV